MIPSTLTNQSITNPSCEFQELEQARLELVSTALVNFLPSLEVQQHAGIFQQIRHNQQCSMTEQGDWSLLDRLRLEGASREGLAVVRSTPSIICTMHMGSYRLLNLFLRTQNIPFALVMGTRVLQQQGALFQEIFQRYDRRGAVLELIDAEQSRSGWQMLRALKAGKSLVLYMDGHTGAGVETQINKNNCVVDFLAQQLFVRKGIAWLAHVAGCPIVPAVMLRKADAVHVLHFNSLIHSSVQPERELFAQQTTQDLYTGFGRLIAADPGQWEGWLTIHQTARIVQNTSGFQQSGNKYGKKIEFNSFGFGIFKTAGQPMLVDKHHYLFYPIGPDLFTLLQTCKESALPVSEVPERLLNDLLEQKILLRV